MLYGSDRRKERKALIHADRKDCSGYDGHPLARLGSRSLYIEFGLQNGTTYNAYLIRGEKTALVDASHEKFRQLYLDTLKGLIDATEIDYFVISHTEPDHSGLAKS